MRVSACSVHVYSIMNTIHSQFNKAPWATFPLSPSSLCLPYCSCNVPDFSCITAWKWKVKVLIAQSCQTLGDPMDCTPPGSSVHGTLQARILQWVAILFSRGSSEPRVQTQVSCTAGRFFTIWASREALVLLQHGNALIHLFTRRRQWQPTPVLLPGKSHGWRSLVGRSLWDREESDTTEWLHFHFSLSCIGEGNGNSLQCSCLENPRDGGAWWAAVYGVTQSRTRLKQLSGSGRSCERLKNRSPGVLKFMGSQRAGHSLGTWQQLLVVVLVTP